MIGDDDDVVVVTTGVGTERGAGVSGTVTAAAGGLTTKAKQAPSVVSCCNKSSDKKVMIVIVVVSILLSISLMLLLLFLLLFLFLFCRLSSSLRCGFSLSDAVLVVCRISSSCVYLCDNETSSHPVSRHALLERAGRASL